MSKRTPLQLVSSRDGQPLSEALVRAVIFEDDFDKAEKILERMNQRATLVDAADMHDYTPHHPKS